MVAPSHPAEWSPVTAATRNYGTAAAPRQDREGCGQLASRLGAAGTGLLVLGGVLYSAVYALRRPNPVPSVFGYHEVFHALVIAAAAAHYITVAFCVLLRRG
jgi:hypothetical protein